MKRLSAVSILLASFIALTMSSAMAGSQPVQVYAEQVVDFGHYATFLWNWSGDVSVVPPKKVLSITSATFSYVAADTAGTVGRADLAGRNALGNAVWRQQVVYVQPYTTLQLTFPQPLLLEEGGYVEVGFVHDGPGTISVSLQGYLVDKF